MGAKPKLGLDLDGVVYAFDIGACVALKMHGACDLDVRESDHWNDIQDRVSPEDWDWLWTQGVREAFNDAPLYPGVVDELHQIQGMMDIVVITHRPRAVIDVTLRRLAEAELRPVAVHHVQGGKESVAPDCVAYIDDKVENVLDLAQLDVPVFMPRKPWNSELHNVVSMPSVEGSLDIRPYDDFTEVTRWVRSEFGN